MAISVILPEELPEEAAKRGWGWGRFCLDPQISQSLRNLRKLKFSNLSFKASEKFVY